MNLSLMKCSLTLTLFPAQREQFLCCPDFLFHEDDIADGEKDNAQTNQDHDVGPNFQQLVLSVLGAGGDDLGTRTSSGTRRELPAPDLRRAAGSGRAMKPRGAPINSFLN